jgi:hypothetical protein
MIAILTILQIKLSKYHQKFIQSNIVKNKIQKFDICSDIGITDQVECDLGKIYVLQSLMKLIVDHFLMNAFSQKIMIK